MFTSKTSVFCLRKCIAYQQCNVGVNIRNKPIAENTKMRYHHFNRSEFLSVANGTFSDCWGKGNIHMSCIQYGSKNLLKKFAKKTKKKLWYETPTFVPKPMLPFGQTDALQPSTPKKNKESNLRTRILNSILFKAVSDFLSSHEVSSEVYNLHVEISKVSLPPDFSSCRVYWKTSGTSEKDSLIQQVLDKNTARIRYLLISHQILGNVPPLVFIKDKQYAAHTEVEDLLKLVNLGLEEKAQGGSTDNLEDRGTSSQLANSSGDPAMKKDGSLFGIDHEALNKQVLEYKQRSRETPHSTPPLSLTQQQLDMLAELRRQKVMEKKKKSRRPVDDDITPKAYLLARYSQGQGSEEEEGLEYSSEESQVKELMAEEDRRS